MGQKSYYLLDIYKFIAALLVIALHVNPMISYGGMPQFLLNQGICRIAVPIFFAISGFLLAERGFEKGVVFKYLKRIIIMYAVWNIIYLPFVDVAWVTNGSLNTEALSAYAFSIVYSGSFLHLWYFPALIFAVFVLWLLLKKLSINTVLVISGILYTVGLLADQYSRYAQYIPLLGRITSWYIEAFSNTNSGIFAGLPFVSLGAFASFNKEKFCLKPSLCAALVLASIALMYGEILLADYLALSFVYAFYFALVPAALSLMLLAINVDLPKKNEMIYVWFRQSSALIYVSQPLLRLLFDRLMEGHGIHLYGQTLVYYLVNVVIAAAFAAAVLRLERVKGFSFLKYLH